MQFTFWGVRGSIPSPMSNEEIRWKLYQALKMARAGDLSSEESINEYIDSLPFAVRNTFGGNTTCHEIRTAAGDLIIIDAGSGIKNLGNSLMTTDFGKGKGMGHILMTHTHWDHVQGLPFFVPMFIKGNVFNFYSPMKDLKERLEYQQDGEHFPVTLDYMAATKHFHYIEPETEFFINDARIISKAMPHPGGAYGYRVESGGRVAVYSSDCEFNINSIEVIDQYRSFFENADLLVFDTQYTFEESIDKMDYGHSHASIAIDIAASLNVKKLILFHHEPNYHDEKLEDVLVNARSYLNLKKRKQPSIDLSLDIACEGVTIDLSTL